VQKNNNKKAIPYKQQKNTNSEASVITATRLLYSIMGLVVIQYRGVDKVFKTLAKLASSQEFSLAKSDNWPNI
jgi:hypothetical protein